MPRAVIVIKPGRSATVQFDNVTSTELPQYIMHLVPWLTAIASGKIERFSVITETGCALYSIPPIATAKDFIVYHHFTTLARTIAAVIENYQQKDGTILIPQALRPYMQNLETIKTR